MSPMLPDVDLVRLAQRVALRLAGMRRALRRHFLAEGLAILTTVAVLAAAFSLLADWQFELSRPVRLGCLVAFALGLGWIAYRHLFRPLTMPLEPLDLAAAIDRTTTGPAGARLATRVATVLELPRQLDRPEEVSQALLSRAVVESYRELEGFDYRRHLNGKHLWLSAAALAAALLIPAAFALGAPSVARLWRDRWLLGSDRPWPHSTRIEVADLQEGRLIVPRGEPSSLRVSVVDSEKETDAVWMRMTLSDGGAQTVTLNRFAPGDFRFDLPPFQEPVRVELWGGDGRAEPFQIDPRDRPRMTALKLTAKPPRNGGTQEFNFAGDEGNIRLLPQTDATLEFETNVPIASVRVDAEPGAPEAFERLDDQKFRARWVQKGQVRLRVSLVAADSGLESFPRPINIGEKPDRPPTVSMRHSGVRMRVTSVATIPLALTVRDDYGVRSIDLAAAVDRQRNAGSDASALPAGDDEDSSSTIDDSAPDAPQGESPQAPATAPSATGAPAVETPDESKAAEPAEGQGGEPSTESSPPASEQNVPAPAASPEIESTSTPAAAPDGLSLTAFLTEKDANPADAGAATGPADAGVFEPDESDPPANGDTPPTTRPTEVNASLFGPVEPAMETAVEPRHSVELSGMELAPGQSLVITARAEDDCFTGRQSTVSRKLIFKIVKDDELFKEILLRQQQLRSRLQKSYEQMIELRDTLKTVDVEGESGNLLRTYLLIRREIGAVTRDLEASVLEMRLNRLGGQESWDLIEQTVLQPLTRLQEQELERQKQALETFVGAQPDPVEEVLERQQAIIDALKKVLDNMSQWDSFIDIINQVNSIIKIQEAARRMTDELKSRQLESIFEQ